jgi:hypothetical protein
MLAIPAVFLAGFVREHVWSMNGTRWFGRLDYVATGWIKISSSQPYRKIMESCESRILAGLRLLRTALTIRAYREEEGMFPPTLAALTPAWLDAVPIDLFSGQPLVYRLDVEGCKLYSIGPNGIDDGGQVVPLGDIIDKGDLLLDVFKLDEKADRETAAAAAAAQEE